VKPVRTTSHVPRSAQRGVVLALVLPFALVVLAIATLTLDLGLARAHQGTMQLATEAAALEGLAWRDVPRALTDADREELRRELARAQMLRVVDEDGRALDALVDGTLPNSEFALGFGPVVSIAEPDQLEGSTLAIPDGALVPDPQLNLDNAQSGDLVAGTFAPAPDPVSCAMTLGVPLGFLENALYERCDFDVPAEGVPAATLQAQGAFLARARRTNDRLGLDDVPGVSSNGPPFPYLWGRGALLDRTPNSPLHEGITVRATSIAEARPAVVASIGNAFDAGLALVDVDGDGDGLADGVGVLAFEAAAWAECLAADVVVPVVFAAAGSVEVLAPCSIGPVVGRVIELGATSAGLVALGEPAHAAGSGLAIAPGDLAFVPLYTTPAFGPLGDERVIGFGAVRLVPPVGTESIGVERLEGPAGTGLVVPRGASALVVPARHPVLPAATLSALLTLNVDLPFPLRAAALAR